MQRHRRLMTLIAAAGICAASVVAGENATASIAQVAEPMSIESESYELSAPASGLGRDDRAADGDGVGSVNPPRVNPEPGRTGEGGSAGPAADPLSSSSRRASGRTPEASQSFDGLANLCNCLPPDTVGDVGPNHYVQMTNSTKVAIFTKTGTPVGGPFDFSSLWSSGDCSDPDDGDPIVLWDSLAGRWVLMQFHVSAPLALCFAVSQTSDPTGAYHLYQFNTPEFPDYPKVSVWPTGYYVGTNESTYAAYALDRSKMLIGDPTANGVRFGGESNFLLPADVDGTTAPDPQGGIFYTFKDNAFHGGSDRIELFRLTPDYATPANSTFTNFLDIPISSFTYTPCGFFVLDCINQLGTLEGLDPVGEWPMHRFAYRRFATHEALIGTFTVGGAGAESGAAPRWFELRNTGGGYSLFQEGTHDPPDNHDRWMGSIAMDQAGNIALGYSVSSSTMFPSIRYATRLAGDPLGTLQAEQTLQAGGGSQTSTANRWGDYASMNVDPADDCGFWFTSEYYSATSSNSWKTRIGSFTEPSCAPPDTDGDGVDDDQDACPNQAGTLPNGCPDSDGDGVANAQDACPNQAGTLPNGCPDSDGDGVADAQDPCPMVAGPGGCPVNDIAIVGKPKLNKKKGTAKIKVAVPGDGQLDLSGKRVKPRSEQVDGPGTVRLRVVPNRKTKKKLNRKGKAKVNLTIGFTPTGGLEETETKAIKLKKKR